MRIKYYQLFSFRYNTTYNSILNRILSLCASKGYFFLRSFFMFDSTTRLIGLYVYDYIFAVSVPRTISRRISGTFLDRHRWLTRVIIGAVALLCSCDTSAVIFRHNSNIFLWSVTPSIHRLGFHGTRRSFVNIARRTPKFRLHGGDLTVRRARRRLRLDWNV